MSMARKILESRDARKLRVGMNLLGTCSKALGKSAWILRYHPWTSAKKTNLRWLPINQNISLPDNTNAPVQLLERLIEETTHRVIYDFCSCRKAFACQNYPTEIGCLLMGDSAVESPSSVSREVGVQEAKDHVRRAVAAGLVPLVGKARIDNSITGIKDRAKLLTACFCCECCCIARNMRHLHHTIVEPILPRLDGISIAVTEDCNGCGICMEHCFIQAIRLKEGKAFIESSCRACGRCAAFCPHEAIRIHIDDPDFLDKTYERVRAHVTFD